MVVPTIRSAADELSNCAELEPAVEPFDRGLRHMGGLTVAVKHGGRGQQRVVALGQIAAVGHAVRIDRDRGP
jgi:hypothetical protein